MPVYEVSRFNGGISDFEDRGIAGSFKFGSNLDIRKIRDSLTCNQALKEEGLLSASSSPSSSTSPSSSQSPSASPSATPSPSASTSPSSSASSSASPSTGISSSPSLSPSASASPSASTSPSHSTSPSPSPSSGLNTVFKDLILFFVEASDGYTYEFGDTGYIYRRDADGNHIQVYKDPDGAIKGASEWYSDAGETFLFFATDTLLKKKNISGLSSWNDVVTVGNLTSADWHTMREAGGSLIIANGGKLALVGYDQSFTNEAVNLIPGNIAKTIIERDGRTIAGTVRASNPDIGINGAIDSEVPLAQVGTDGELFYSNMVDSIPVKRFPGGGQVNPGGVVNMVEQVNFFEWEQNALSWIDKQTVGNLSMWGVFGAETGKNGIYSFGRKNKNHPFVMNLEYKMDVDEIGALANVDGTIIASYRNGADFGVVSVDPNNKATATWEGIDFKSPIKKPINITKYDYVEVFCKPMPANTEIKFYYRMDKTGDFVQAKTADGNDAFTTAGADKAVFRINAEGQVYEPRLVLIPSGNETPEIFRKRTYFV